MSRDVVGMGVCLEHAHDPEVMLFGRLEVLLDRVGGIDDHRFARRLVADQVRPATEVLVDELPKKHGPRA